MWFRVLSFFLIGLLRGKSLSPPLLSGPVGPDFRIVAASRRSAFNHIKFIQLQQVKHDAPAHICRELDLARELLRDPARNEECVAFLASRHSDQILFTIIYRVCDRLPSVYTLEAIVREPGYDVCSSDLQHALRQLVAENRGFLQSYPLKIWSGGRYFKESFLEYLLP